MREASRAREVMDAACARENPSSSVEDARVMPRPTGASGTLPARAEDETSDVVALRSRVDVAERAARESELVARSKVSKAFERVREAEARASTLEARVEAVRLEGELARRQAVEAGERIARSLRARLDEAKDEIAELRRRDAVREAEAHGAQEAARRGVKLEEELKRVKHQLADAEMSLCDSESAVRALQFQLDMGGDSNGRDDARELRERRLLNELDETRALATKSTAEIDRLNAIVASLRDDLASARDTAKRLVDENDALSNRVDAAEKQIEINALLGTTSVKHEDLDKLQTTASKVDLIVAENRRLESERNAAVTARNTAEDTSQEAKSTLACEREEFETWRRKARELMDSKDREIDRMRGLISTNSAPRAAPKAVLLPKPRTTDEDISYIKTVVMSFLYAEEWEVQQSLLSTVVTLCGGSAEDLERIKEIRSQFEPTFVHSAEVAINKSLGQSANAIATTLGLPKFF